MGTEQRSTVIAHRAASRWSLVLLPVLLVLLLAPAATAAEQPSGSMVFESTPDDGHLRLSGSGDWDALRSSQGPAELWETIRFVKINTRPDIIYRGFLFFDTAELPDNILPTRAVLRIYAKCTGDLDDAGLYVLAGTEAYPHRPLLSGDYALPTEGLAVCARVDAGGWTHELAYREIALDTPGAVVRTDGVTKLVLLERRDYENDAPPDVRSENEVKLYSYEEGEAFRPYLEVFWGSTATMPDPDGHDAPAMKDTAIRPGSIAAICVVAGVAAVLLWRQKRPRHPGHPPTA